MSKHTNSPTCGSVMRQTRRESASPDRETERRGMCQKAQVMVILVAVTVFCGCSSLRRVPLMDCTRPFDEQAAVQDLPLAGTLIEWYW